MEESPEQLSLISLSIDPETSPINKGIDLKLLFKVSKSPIKELSLEVTYKVDMASKSSRLELLRENVGEWDMGEHEIVLKVPDIDLEGIKRRELLNVGLLAVRAVDLQREGEGELILINMLVQVTKGEEKTLFKKIISPFE